MLDTLVLERSEASALYTSSFVVPTIIYDKLFQSVALMRLAFLLAGPAVLAIGL